MLLYKLKKTIKIKIDLPINTPQSAIFGFLNHEYNTDIINHLLLIFKYCLFNSRVLKKLIPEVLKKEIVKIYNIEKQICLNDLKCVCNKTINLKSEWILLRCHGGRGLFVFFCIYFITFITWVSATVRVHVGEPYWHYIMTTSFPNILQLG